MYCFFVMFGEETSLGVYGDGGRELYVGGLKAYVYKCCCLANEAVVTHDHSVPCGTKFCGF